MTEALAAIGSIGTVGALALVATLAVWLHASQEARLKIAADKLASDRAADGYRAERDAAVIELAAARAELAATTGRLARDDTQRNDATAAQAVEVHDAILAAPDPAACVDELLAQPFTAAGHPAPAAAHGLRVGGAPGVPPAGAAGSHRAGGDAGPGK